MAEPVVELLRRVREAHGVTQVQVAGCMNIDPATYRHVESGRRPLPDLRRGLIRWIKDFERCVGASIAERKEILKALSARILEEFSELLEDLRGDP